MGSEYKIVILALLASSFVSVYLFLYLRGKEQNSKSLFFITYLLLACGWWSFWNALEYLASTFTAKLLATNFIYLSVTTIPALWFLFGRAYAAEEQGKTPPKVPRIIWIIPVITCFFVWTDSFWGLFRKNMHLVERAPGFFAIAKDYNVWFWVHSAYSYILIFVGITYLIKGIVTSKTTKKHQVFLLIPCALLPGITNFIYITKRFPIPGVDPTAIAFSLTGILVIINMRRFKFLSVVSIAREKALDNLREAVLVFDADSCLAYSNTAANELFNIGTKSIGTHCSKLGKDLAKLAVLKDGEELEIAITTENPDILDAVLDNLYDVRASQIIRNDRPVGITIILYDITRRVCAEEALKTANQQLEHKVEVRTKALSEANERLKEELERSKRMERQLTYTSLYDSLTGLPNRNLLVSRIEQSIVRFNKNPASPYGIVFLDIDNFKMINDMYGHHSGDSFLREIATRIRKCVQTIDTVSRIGSDEFVVLLDGTNRQHDIESIIDRINEVISEPLTIGTAVLVPTASFGYLLSRPEISDAEEVLRNAGLAMYQAKGSAHKRVAFTDQMLFHAQEKNRLTSDLRLAIEQEQIKLAFQPIVYMDGSIAGWEVLARWTHPEFGIIVPDRFIPIAEESGLIIPLGSYVLIETLKTAKKMVETDFFKSGLMVEQVFFAVNVSAVQLIQDDFADFILSSIRKFELPYSILHIELTESTIIQNREAVIAMIDRLSAYGISFKLDDFGTGYSSLDYLDRIPIDTVKIDRSFIIRMEKNGEKERSSAEVVRGIIALSHELGKTVVAEGIDSPTQVEILTSFGCDYGQGYYFGKPVDADALAVTLLKMSFIKENIVQS